jgi:pyruvate formate lyase activating enzyme
MLSGLPYEFRTTVVPELLVAADIDAMGQAIKGADKWYLQKFKSDTALVDSGLEGGRAYTDQEMKELAVCGGKYVKFCALRA